MTWHPLPTTPEVYAAVAKGQDEALAALGIAARDVAVWEDGYRVAKDADTHFEWWYFDVQFEDGSTLVVTFSNKPNTAPAGPVAPVLLVIRQQPDGTSVKHELPFPAEVFTAATEQCDVAIGPNTVKGDLHHYELHVEIEGFAADVTIGRVAPSWRPGAGITYIDSAKTQYMGWVVPVPYGTATATITESGATKTLSGSAYHDHNWGNRLMGSFLHHWFWGRAHVGDYTLVYVMLFSKGFMGLGQFQIPTFYLAKGGELVEDDMLPLRLTTSGEVDGPLGHTYPTRLEWVWEKEGRGRVAFTATNPKLIEALDMGNQLKGLSRILHPDDHQAYFDFNADFELTIDLDDLKDEVTGKTLYEKMMFR